MIAIQRSEERGHADHGWRKSYHSFSFGTFNDPNRMGFRSLKVLNEDRIDAGRGFGAHAHRDMEIITYVLEGAISHKDSLGEVHTFGPNTIQAMSAGLGVIHSEFNGSKTEPLHLLQIWIEPSSEDVEPAYQQIEFAPSEKQNRFRLIASPDKNSPEQAAFINQDARIFAAELSAGKSLKYALAPGRSAWVQVARGDISVNGQKLAQGDAAAVIGEDGLRFEGVSPESSEFLLFDLA
jgi:redox-sensitive bicupin YhaK (pirin superfamily)